MDVDEVVGLFERWGPQHYDDRVSQLDHALQCAALARHDGADDLLVVAALLHDLGHLMELDRAEGQVGDLSVDRHHEFTAARALALLFPLEVVRAVELHVEAKRYLCAIDSAYSSGLSDGSVRSLVTQGGPMSADEAAEFETRPGAHDAMRLRRWDDLGKSDDAVVAPLSSYVPLLRALAR